MKKNLLLFFLLIMYGIKLTVNAQIIAAGQNHCLAACGNGTMQSWGWNVYGQLGDGTRINRTMPVMLSNLNNIKSISASYFHALALKNDGTVWTWGNNKYGKLGIGNMILQTAPVQVVGLHDVVDISCTAESSAALLDDGTVLEWGTGAIGDRIFTPARKN